MKLFNQSQKKLITDNLKIANTFQLRNRGLIGLEKSESFSLFLKTRFGIHTFGLKFALTILVCDNNLEVVKIKKNLKPNSLFFWNPNFQNIIELPEIIVETTRRDVSKNFASLQTKPNFKIGDKLELMKKKSLKV